MLRLISWCAFFLISFTLQAQEVRSFDGYKNNPVHPEWGAAHFSIEYQVPPAYADGISEPAGPDRPNARLISNRLFEQIGLLNDIRSLSAFTWAWGQFIDHDITLTHNNPDELFPISVPAGDRFFDPAGTGAVVIPLNRSDSDPATGSGPDNPRKHINSISAYIDGSAVYGSDLQRANWLRTFQDGKLKISAGNMPPFNTLDGEYDGAIDPDAPVMDMPIPFVQKYYVCGDLRANENPNLLAIHTLWVREHNRICDEIKARLPHYDDEAIYQHARRLIGGMIQAIVYEEWLPALGVHLPHYEGYRIDVNAQIMNVFSAAAYRYGHTTITPILKRMDENGLPIPQGDIDLRFAFFNPTATIEVGGIEPYLSGMAYVTQQELDLSVIDDLRNFLFGRPGAGGLDLVSLNIQRGRERGLPSLNAVREAFGLTPYSDFHDMNPDPKVSNKMRECYGSLEMIDPWVGMLSEEHMPDALFGPTAMKIIEEQFTRLRDGDRFYFEMDPNIGYAEKTNIKNTRLADVIRRNTGIAKLQDEVFKVEDLPTGVRPNGLSVEQVSLYPNPASEFVVLELGDPVHELLNVRLYDITGRTWITAIMPADRSRMELTLPEGMRPGYYWISMTGTHQSWLGRFVKN